MMVKLGIWSPDITVACFSHMQTKIYIIESHFKVSFVQPADFMKDALFYNQTGRSNDGQGLDKLCAPKITEMASR
ncbi:hypothetical protein GALL_446450 [mine drainage metagenome]|uniref:Uncharacterized protein n=1 Tax=mine drainage metagenome TaxID=410659 RepID=A0A1J5QCL6_9ZZZZ